MATAFAVYSADDNSLRFYKRDTVPTVGDTFEELTVTAVYTGIETDTYDGGDSKAPWYSYNSSITSAIVADEGIAPVSTAYWFYQCIKLTTADLGKLDTSKITNMKRMFDSCIALAALDVSSWDTSLVTDMSWMFENCILLTTLDTFNWNTSLVTDMGGMFISCYALTGLDVSGWDTSKVTDMSDMFNKCSALAALDVSDWDTSSVTSMSWMFYKCAKLTTVYAGDGWSTAAVTNSYDMFTGCTALVGQSGTAYDSSKVDATMANYETGYLTYKRYVKQAPYLIQNTTLYNIADAIRAKNGSTATMTPAEMVVAIAGMQVDGIRVNTVGEGEYTVGYYADAACIVRLTESAIYALLPDGDVWAKKGIYGPWATAPDSNVAAAIAAAQAGELDLSTIWSVGDTRKVQLSAMAATGVGESHVAQEVEIVLMDFQQLYDYTDGSGKCQVIWGLKNGLANGTTGETGYMNSSNTNSGGWNTCSRRTWCNEVFYKSLPDWMQQATKQVNVITASGSSSSTAISADLCFLPAEKEVYGSTTYANSTAESSLKQWTWYATSGNRIKKCGADGSASSWLERSPGSGYSSRFCSVSGGGSASYTSASFACLLAPSGCF